MENISSWTRNWILWYLLFILICSCVAVVQKYDDNDDRKRISGRKAKLDELLKVLKNNPSSAKDQVEDYKSKHILMENKTKIMAPLGVEYDLLTPLPTTDSSENTEHLAQIPPPSVSSYEDFYRIFYGTEEGISHLKKHYGPEGLHRARAKYKSVTKGMEDVRRASDHFLRIRTEARCKTPVPTLIRVKDYYPNPSRIYLPRCTLLHRCGEISGCCDSDAYECVPSTVKEVTLHFYKLTVNRNGLGYGANQVERLVFLNHTSCHCQEINERPRMASINNRQKNHHHHRSRHHTHGPNPLDGPVSDANPNPTIKSRSHSKHHQMDSKAKCRDCPVPFTSRIYRDGRCGCDCFDRQKSCLKIKRGRRPLAEIERRCVAGKFCLPPACEYGSFDAISGFCPRRHDEPPRDHAMSHSRSKTPSLS